MAIKKALVLIKDILVTAKNLGIDNPNNSSVISKLHNEFSEIRHFDLAELARDPKQVLHIFNNFITHCVSSDVGSQYLETWMGTYRTTSHIWYLTTKRDMSFHKIIQMFRKDDNITLQIQ